MMLAHPKLDTVFDFSKEFVNALVIENPAFFRTFLRDILEQTKGCSGEAVLSRDDVPISFAKNAEILDALLDFEIGKKSLMTKILAQMEAAALNESNYLRTTELMGELEQYIQQLTFDLPCDIICSKMSIGGVFRSAGIEISDDYTNDLERILDYMELTRELERDKLFVFVNLRSFYSDEDIAAFCASVLNHEFSVLLVDSVAREKVPGERRVTVDIDLCEF